VTINKAQIKEQLEEAVKANLNLSEKISLQKSQLENRVFETKLETEKFKLLLQISALEKEREFLLSQHRTEVQGILNNLQRSESEALDLLRLRDVRIQELLQLQQTLVDNQDEVKRDFDVSMQEKKKVFGRNF